MNSLFDWQQWGEEVAQIISTSAHIVGFLGMMCVVLAFWLVVSEKWKPTSLSYNLLNGGGAILLILSLCVHFNLGSFVIEVFWIAIAGMGIIKNLKAKKSQKQ
ncbi:MAG: permease [Alysiella sp.]|uniref:CBU_0592 family membrane protein n=1 Tax=Alysiella sp. TaxID=1872483 RepID=UPI0026DB98E2|nr:permease [Alysiella sp.]MDO4434754.1 permease [Alysiella sp.]